MKKIEKRKEKTENRKRSPPPISSGQALTQREREKRKEKRENRKTGKHKAILKS